MGFLFGAFGFGLQAQAQAPPGGRYSNCRHHPWEAPNLWEEPAHTVLPPQALKASRPAQLPIFFLTQLL